MRVLVIGQNTKMANVFSFFSEVFIVVDKKIKNFRKYKEIEKFHVLSSDTDIKKTSSIIKRFKEIKIWVKEYDIDVIFTNEKNSMLSAKLVSLSLKRKVKLLSTSHNSYAWQENNIKVKLFSKLIDFCNDGFVALATFVSNLLRQNGVSDKKILCLPNTIEYELFKQKQTYNFLQNEVKLVYVATIYPGKGQDILIKAVKLLKAKNINIKLDMYGDVIDEDFDKQLLDYIEDNNLLATVTFKGRVGNDFIKSCLSDYDIYVSPSKMEMSPYNILEAKAAALPIIAYKVGGVPDLIKDNHDGILLDSFDPAVLADNIQRLIEDETLRKKIAIQAYRSVSSVNAPKVSSYKLQNFILNL